MDKKLVNYIVRRYLRFDKEQPFIFLSALLAFLGIMVGVMVLIIAMAIMNGFDKEFEKKLFTMNYPLTVFPKYSPYLYEDILKTLQKEFPSLRYSPYISSQVIYKKGDKLEGGIVFGVDFAKEREINDVLASSLKKVPQKFEIIVGKQLFDELYLVPGEKIFLLFTKSEPSGFSITPIFKRFKVVGTFSSGLIAYDKAYSYTILESLRKVLRFPLHTFSGIHIYSPNPQKDLQKIKEVLPNSIGIVGWWQQNGNFFAALAMEKRALFIVLMLIILIASLNIVSSLLMTVMNRRKEIALLLSLGATPKEIRSIFFKLGSIIGGVGILFGVAFGFLGLFILQNFDIIQLPADVYGTAKLPVDLSLQDLTLIIFGAIAIILLSATYPARKATKINVIEVLRNE
ncbi:putative ABC transport system permease protein [Nitratiruptor sp. YY08-26]|uniref:ABC transporter permease n=1 Tax=unclassified Nitratiruptor TaxID=2624044 RepID=UPI0019155D9E|nr:MULTISPECIES: ABC transporter permease [unclassified Nitratiruptor]BCD62183.1 putative ABC transport system permease protein [Nitratiruptor sp. YY08-13]BCD66119.1 putative ABC transport system permease protein [Nitratiruptor sp. YY08-26]